MIIKHISDNELRKACAMVRCSMLDSLPENPDGQFSDEFLKSIDELRAEKRRIEKQQCFRKRFATAVAAFIIAMTVLFSLNTEVRATVATWFKEVYETFTTYWFAPEIRNNLPTFELSETPEDFICIHDETLSNSRSLVYQNETDPSLLFSIRYALLQPDAPLTASYPSSDFDCVETAVNGCSADLYISNNQDESHALVWIDESNGVVFTITAFGDPNDMLHIASLLKLVK